MARKPAPKPVTRQWRSIPYGADYADVSTRTIRRWIAAGLLPAHRVGPRLIKIDLADLDRLVRPIPTAGGGPDAA